MKAHKFIRSSLKKALTVSILLAASSFGAGAQNENGRFQLMTGNVREIAKGINENTPVIIKIDTQTGKTWVYVRLLAEGKFQEFWAPIPERN
jgi:hypothetical protein